MKTIVFLMSILFSLSVMAGTVNLNVGESILIQANAQTLVTCGGADGKCITPIKNLKSVFAYCKSSGNSIEDCLIEHWPAFRSGYSSCIDEAFQTCLDFCKSDPFGLECLQLCKKF